MCMQSNDSSINKIIASVTLVSNEKLVTKFIFIRHTCKLSNINLVWVVPDPLLIQIYVPCFQKTCFVFSAEGRASQDPFIPSTHRCRQFGHRRRRRFSQHRSAHAMDRPHTPTTLPPLRQLPPTAFQFPGPRMSSPPSPRVIGTRFCHIRVHTPQGLLVGYESGSGIRCWFILIIHGW